MKHTKNRLTKRELLRRNNLQLSHLRRAENIADGSRDAMRDNVASYFGVEVGDEVECQSSHRGAVHGVVTQIRFHYPCAGRKVETVGSVWIRPWKKTGKKRELCRTNVNDACFTDRKLVKLVAKNVVEGRRFIR